MNQPESPDKLVSQSLSALAFQRLERAIMEGEIKPGERLSESGLARRFGISRGPLREALGQLEGRRLVERVSNQGARVISLSRADLLDLLTVRESLEGMACRLAATRITAAETARLERLLADHADSQAVRSGRGYFQDAGDGDFHQIILNASGNQRLIGLLGGELYALLRLYRHHMSMRPGRPAAALAEHRIIVDAIRARDGDRAEAAMRDHIRQSRAAVEDVAGAKAE